MVRKIMNTIPDKWAVVKIVSPQGTVYKVIGSWYGGYLYGNSWRMNSGITRVELSNGRILFYGYSGSCYECYPTNYGMHLESSGIVEQLGKMTDVTVDVLPLETEWDKIDYGTL